ncbi:hypothetical protein [Pedobacter rhodius]|uniref:CSD domain-containing protein n=1 Tax=Pedobacter rhodius TaxID=3004098 RepID=A0ABT4KTX6_9SPHI|nr:hypothetical protein [Pedobacter sp. SJ11]MCZ4222375.1 hypothetical protein [Pedobacter sp. SJ11]
MRTGIILSINRVAGVGILKDFNNQTIRFYVEDSEKNICRGDTVNFDIFFKQRGLVAVNIRKCIMNDNIDV